MTVYAFPPAAHVDADNLPGQSFNWHQDYVGIDLTGYTATMTIDGIAVNLPCVVTVTPVGANVYSTVTLTTLPGTITNTFYPGVYAYRVTMTAPDASTSSVAYGDLLELTPRVGTVYGTVGPQGIQGVPGPAGGGGGSAGYNVKYLSSYGADFSATWAASQTAADAAWTAAQAAMAAASLVGANYTLLLDSGNVLAHSTNTFQVYQNCSVYGCGGATNIKTTANTPVFTIVGVHATIADLRVFGDSGGVNNGGNTKTLQQAVFNGGSSNFYDGMYLRSIYALQMSGDAFLFQGTQTGTEIWTSMVVNCGAHFGQRRGFAVLATAEYVKFTDCDATYNVDSNVAIGAGNTTINGGSFTRSQTAGIELLPGFNNSHGSVTGAKVNHNYTTIKAGAITDGFLFSNCHLLGDGILGQMTFTSSIGVRFNQCHIPGHAFIFDGSMATVFDDSCTFDESGGAMVITDNANGHASQTFWGDCRTLADATLSPPSIRARRQIPGFSSDADHTLTLQEDTAVSIVVPSGLLTTTRALTSPRAPSVGVTPVLLVNNSGNDVTYQWSSGTAVTVAPGSRAYIGSDGTNAIALPVGNVSDAAHVTLSTTTSTANQIIETHLVPDNSAELTDYYVSAKLSGSSGAAYWKVTVGVERNSGGAAVLNYNPGATLLGAYGGLSTLTNASVSVAVSGTTGAIDFRITPLASNIRTAVTRFSPCVIGAAGGATFPVPGMIFNWDASNVGSVSSSGGLASQVNNLSGTAGPLVQATAKPGYGTTTQNSLNTLDCTANKFMVSTLAAGLTDFTFQVVFKTGASVAGAYAVAGNDSGGFVIQINGGNVRFVDYVGGALIALFTDLVVTANTWHVISVRRTGTVLNAWLDATKSSVVGTVSTALTTTTFVLGNDDATVSVDPSTGQFGQAMGYNTSRSDSDVGVNAAGLKAKWNTP